MQTTHSVAPVLVYGAYGHTARFIVAELLDRGFTPVLAARDRGKLAAASAAHGGLEWRAAVLDDPSALDRALVGMGAVINAAGPFAVTATPIIEAAIRARLPYLDIAAEPDVVSALWQRHASQALQAGIPFAPALGFYGGLGDLLVTAALAEWPQADETTLAYALSSWKPTRGTRATIEVAEARRGGQRLMFSPEHGLQLRGDPAPVTEWEFPLPLGRQPVVAEFVTADAITMSQHLKSAVIHEYMTSAPLEDLGNPDDSPPAAVDARGRSAQTFLIEAVVRRGARRRSAVVRGQDIYAVTAPLVVEALRRLVAQPGRWRGGVAAGELGDASDFLAALSPRHLTVEINRHA